MQPVAIPHLSTREQGHHSGECDEDAEKALGSSVVGLERKLTSAGLPAKVSNTKGGEQQSLWGSRESGALQSSAASLPPHAPSPRPALGGRAYQCRSNIPQRHRTEPLSPPQLHPSALLLPQCLSGGALHSHFIGLIEVAHPHSPLWGQELARVGGGQRAEGLVGPCAGLWPQ